MQKVIVTLEISDKTFKRGFMVEQEMVNKQIKDAELALKFTVLREMGLV